MLGSIKDDDPPEKNVRAWLLLGWLNYYRPGLISDFSPIEREKPYAAGTRSPRNVVFLNSEAYDSRQITLGAILNQAIAVGWIRPKDANWIQNKLGMSAAKF